MTFDLQQGEFSSWNGEEELFEISDISAEDSDPNWIVVERRAPGVPGLTAVLIACSGVSARSVPGLHDRRRFLAGDLLDQIEPRGRPPPQIVLIDDLGPRRLPDRRGSPPGLALASMTLAASA